MKKSITSNGYTMTTHSSSGSDRAAVVKQPCWKKNESAHHQQAAVSRRKQKETSRQSGINDLLHQSSAVVSPSTKENVRTQDEAHHQVQVSMEDTGRERLKRHRVEVAGQVWIPDIWGQEELLKDWIDCSAFEASVVNTSIMSARAALVEEGRRAHSTRLRIENRC